jgi:hypothetical protein
VTLTPDDAVSALIVALVLVLAMAAGAVFGPSPSRRLAAVLFAVTALVLPFFAHDPFSRALAALGSMLLPMRIVEAWRTTRAPVLPRWLGFVLPIDLELVRRAPPRLATESIARALFHGLLGAVGIAIVSSRHATAQPELVAWLGGTIAGYGLVDALASTLRAVLAGLGVDSAPMQRDPILSTSVGEFWGERWNRAVGAWLRRHVFFPVTRRAGVLAGVGASFLWSGLFHGYAVFASVGVAPALRMTAFFLVQGLFVALEIRFGARRWPRPLARAWTIAAVLGSSVLFIEPMLECVGVR